MADVADSYGRETSEEDGDDMSPAPVLMKRFARERRREWKDALCVGISCFLSFLSIAKSLAVAAASSVAMSSSQCQMDSRWT